MSQSQNQTRVETFQRTLDRLLRLEALTTDLLTCPQEQMTDRLNERQALMDEIRGLVETDAAAAETPLPGDEALMELTAQCRAVACRMQQLDAQAIARMQNIQQQILKKIRAVGKSAGAKAARYYTPHSQGSSFSGSI